MKIKIILMIAMFVFLASSAYAQYSGFNSFASVDRDYRVDVNSIYARDFSTYWPQLQDPESCFAREDLILQVSPAGCQPTVVRSDLLAEQDVPVFCQIDGLKVNPLVDIKQIKSVRFRGDYPESVVGAGFHPARAALRSQDRLLGDPLINNLGYVVTVLKRNPVEESLPDKIEFDLHALLEYETGDAFGIGKNEFLLEEQNDEEWLSERNKQSFWQGRYFVRLEEAQPDFVDVSIYHGDRKVTTKRIERGRTSEDIFVPGLYCQAGLQVSYDGFVSADSTARLQVDGDVIEVNQGSKFLNNKCRVSRIDAGKLGDGTVDLVCGSERIELSVGIKKIEVGDDVVLLRDESIWQVLEVIEDGRQYIIERNDEEMSIGFDSIRPEGDSKLLELEHGAETEEYFFESVKAFEEVANDYPAEKISQGTDRKHGEESLERAIILSREFGKQFTEAGLIRDYLNIYPDGDRAREFADRLNDLYRLDESLAGVTINLDNKVSRISLLDLDTSRDPAKAFFVWGRNAEFDVELRSTESGGGPAEITLERVIDADRVEISAVCVDEERRPGKPRYTLRTGEEGENICGEFLTLERVDQQQLAKVRLLPKSRGPVTETNFTVSIGIEKRAIELNPEKASDKIDNLQSSIDQWESLSSSLNDINTGLKSACFATAGVLTAKNFLSGLGGEGFARQKVMKGFWNDECSDLEVDGETYVSVDQCYLENSDKINSDVERVTGILNNVNDRVENIQNRFDEPVAGIGSFIGETNVDRTKAANALVNEEIKGNSKYANYNIEEFGLTDFEGNRIETFGELLEDAKYERGDFNYDQVREIMLNIDLAESSGISSGVRDSAIADLKNIGKSITDNKALNLRLEQERTTASLGVPVVSDDILVPLNEGDSRYFPRHWNIREKTSLSDTEQGKLGGEVSHVARVQNRGANIGGVTIGTGILYVGLSQIAETDGFRVEQVFSSQGTSVGDLLGEGEEFVNEFERQNAIGEIKSVNSLQCSNNYENPEIRFYEVEPYKGMPAVVPIDKANGWYVATEQTLPVFGSIGSFDASGRPVSFWLCNVGEDGREQFFENRGNDICRLVNLNTGEPLNKFSCLSEDEAEKKVSEAVQALQNAARQFQQGKRGSIEVLPGKVFSIGRPAANIPGTQCQDFMSPNDCHLLFNVCDPVICPSSRCDFGGEYPVADVVQSGIIGSTLLCLPNAREGIAVPVCLTGIQAGIDGYLSILQSHQQCLQENLATGQTVGICDEITSVYTCEFFWRQAAPLADVVVPKLFEIATGKRKARGGGEYLNVENAWQNAQDSVGFFTQSYAANSLEAFKIRSTQEAGSEFCRAFVSLKGPKAFESLVEPDSPPQFHAWFSSIPFTDATVPATSQYKVFYHIFSGRDTGVAYSVYLKDPPTSSFFNINPTVPVANGFVPREGFATDTVDFTAPEGYKQLCVRVNDKEECGFTQVSTSFAINYLRDEFVSDELTKRDIDSERECVSGSLTDATALLNPNLQSIAEEAINPEIYNRGVIRICASENPGASTEPTRFVDVGNCGDQSIRCWLDQESVDNALSANLNINEGVKNATLSELKETQLDNLLSTGEILDSDRVNSVIDDLGSQVTNDLGSNRERARELLDIVDITFKKSFYNHHKAALLGYKGKIYEIVARQMLGILKPEPDTSAGSSDSADEDSDIGDFGVESSGETDDTSVVSSPEFLLKLEEHPIIEGRVSYNIYVNDEFIDVFIQDASGNENPVFVLNRERNGVHRIGNTVLRESTLELVIELNPDFPSDISERAKPYLESLRGAVVDLELDEDSRTVSGIIIDEERMADLTDSGVGSRYTLETALDELVGVDARTGSYEDNSEFIDALFSDGILTESEYDDIRGGFLNAEEDMEFVKELLSEKYVEQLVGPRDEDEEDFEEDGQVDEDFDIDPDRTAYTLETALDELIGIDARSGSYSSNREFVDNLFLDGLLTQEEYIEINGEGVFNAQEDMEFVKKVLSEKYVLEIKEKKLSESLSIDQELQIDISFLDFAPIISFFWKVDGEFENKWTVVYTIEDDENMIRISSDVDDEFWPQGVVPGRFRFAQDDDFLAGLDHILDTIVSNLNEISPTFIDRGASVYIDGRQLSEKEYFVGEALTLNDYEADKEDMRSLILNYFGAETDDKIESEFVVDRELTIELLDGYPTSIYRFNWSVNGEFEDIWSVSYTRQDDENRIPISSFNRNDGFPRSSSVPGDFAFVPASDFEGGLDHILDTLVSYGPRIFSDRVIDVRIGGEDILQGSSYFVGALSEEELERQKEDIKFLIMRHYTRNVVEGLDLVEIPLDYYGLGGVEVLELAGSGFSGTPIVTQNLLCGESPSEVYISADANIPAIVGSSVVLFDRDSNSRIILPNERAGDVLSNENIEIDLDKINFGDLQGLDDEAKKALESLNGRTSEELEAREIACSFENFEKDFEIKDFEIIESDQFEDSITVNDDLKFRVSHTCDSIEVILEKNGVIFDSYQSNNYLDVIDVGFLPFGDYNIELECKEGNLVRSVLREEISVAATFVN